MPIFLHPTRRSSIRPAAVLVLVLAATLRATPAPAQSVLVIEDPAERITFGKTFTLVDGFAASDLLPPYYLTEDPWPVAARPQPGRNLTYVSARSALGGRLGPATIDYFYRRDWWLQNNAGAARFYELDRTGGLVASGQTLDIDYRAEGFDADGLRISFAERVGLLHPRDTVVGISLAGLRLHQARFDRARGRFASNGTSASLETDRELWYSGFVPSTHDSLTGFRPPERQEVASYGYGYSVDLGLRHELGSTANVRLVASDVLSHLKWGNVPHLTQRALISGATADDQMATSHPGVSERSTYDTLRFALPPRLLLAVELAPHRRWRLFGEHVWYRDETFPLIGAAYRVNNALQLRTDYDLRWQTVGVRLAYKRFTLGFRTDNLSPRHARAGGGTLRLELDF